MQPDIQESITTDLVHKGKSAAPSRFLMFAPPGQARRRIRRVVSRFEFMIPRYFDALMQLYLP